jgi:phosphopantetheine adenylyltransferase
MERAVRCDDLSQCPMLRRDVDAVVVSQETRASALALCGMRTGRCTAAVVVPCLGSQDGYAVHSRLGHTLTLRSTERSRRS